jgi:hypothetical protein
MNGGTDKMSAAGKDPFETDDDHELLSLYFPLRR